MGAKQKLKEAVPFLLLQDKGFTMVELLMSMVILMSIFVGVMYTFVKGIELDELTRHSSTAVWAIRNKLTQIENTSYDQIYNTFNNATFTDSDLNGTGVTYVDNSNPDFLEVKGAFCWSEKNKRVIGEDTNLNGVLDAGEDTNANGKIDSAAQIVTLIYKT